MGFVIGSAIDIELKKGKIILEFRTVEGLLELDDYEKTYNGGTKNTLYSFLIGYAFM